MHDYNDEELEGLTDQMLQHYVDIGAVFVEIENGQEFLKATPACKYLAPQLWKLYIDEAQTLMSEMYRKGLVNFKMDDKLEPHWFLTEFGNEVLDSADQEKMAVEDIVNLIEGVPDTNVEE